MSESPIELGPMKAWVKAQIDAGRFANEAEAVQAALANLAAHDARISNLQSLVQEGIEDADEGRVHTYDGPADMAADILAGLE